MEENQARSIDPLKVFWSRKWELLIFTMVCTVTSYFFTSFIPKVYESESAVLIDPPQFNKQFEKQCTSPFFSQKGTQDKDAGYLPIGSYRDLVYTSGYLQNVIEQLKLKYPKITNDLYPKKLKNMIRIKVPDVAPNQPALTSGLITFKVTGQNPAMITEIANIITTLLAEESRKMRANEIDSIFKSTRSHYLSIKKTLIGQKHALEIFKRETAVKTHKLNTSISEEKTNNFNHLQSSLEMTLGLRKKTLLFSEVEIVSVRLELAESASKVVSLAAQTKNHPDLLTEDFLREQSKRDSLLAKEKLLVESIENYKRIILALEKKYLREEQAEREISILKRSLEELSGRLAKIQILESEKTSDIRFLSEAIKPRNPIGPKRFNFILISFVISLTLGGVIALAKAHLDNIS